MVDVEKVKIFVCYHKADVVYNINGYYPIQVGKDVSSFDLKMISDNTGDNISKKNPWYCELTAQYWIWKNVKDVDYVGLCHYRRYLDFSPGFFYNFRPYIHSDQEYVKHHSLLSDDRISGCDIIIPSQRSIATPLYDSLCFNHIRKDVDVLSAVISDLYPEYKEDYELVFKEGNKYTPCNILVAKKDIFDQYSKWLFDILFELEKRLTIPMDPYQPRLMGYFSERLLCVFLHHHHEYKIRHLPLIILDDEKNKPLLPILVREKLLDLSCLLYKQVGR